MLILAAKIKWLTENSQHREKFQLLFKFLFSLNFMIK